eukprot:8782486-Lingulodinium_polyedra.AAC.1
MKSVPAPSSTSQKWSIRTMVADNLPAGNPRLQQGLAWPWHEQPGQTVEAARVADTSPQKT